MNALCPGLARFAVAQVRRPPRTLTVDDLPADCGSILEAIGALPERRPDIAVNGYTVTGFLCGPAGNARMVAALPARTAAPVVNPAAAMVDVPRHVGIAEAAIVTLYLAAVNDDLCACLRSAGSAVDLRAEAVAPVTPARRALWAHAA